ncbi:MAG: UDP-glucose/GDP-mannose dehydrogenase family protein [Myxococcota bacterium]
MKIAIIGTGYVGLVTGACFAAMGNTVYCCDVDAEKIELLRKGRAPFYEPGLEQLIAANTRENRLLFSTDVAASVSFSEVVFIAVGTPQGDTGAADLSYVWQAAEDVGRGIAKFTVVATKSTVPVGTTEKVRQIISRVTDKDFAVVSNPEFLKEGDAVNDFMKPDRVVVGADDERAKELMRELYAPYVRTENPVIFMDIPSAEMTKYAANCMLASRISFINEIANICERVGADVNSVRRGIGSDKRIGFQFLFPGLGYGGSCFPKDIKALIQTAREHGYVPNLLETVDAVNDNQRKALLEKVRTHFKGDIRGRTFAIWGLSFKPRTDDIRDAPSITIVEKLLEQGAKVNCYDPQAMENFGKLFGNRITLLKTNYEALDGADALIICTEWNEFRNPDFDMIKQKLKEPVIFDGRNLFTRKALLRRGFEYYSFGLNL